MKSTTKIGKRQEKPRVSRVYGDIDDPNLYTIVGIRIWAGDKNITKNAMGWDLKLNGLIFKNTGFVILLSLAINSRYMKLSPNSWN